ncbi:MAG: Transcription factor TFIIIB component B [Bogoriella megaspora]|nr:MAG: Transcription factor TFIIIB component B [Bogoriella megaspora]
MSSFINKSSKTFKPRLQARRRAPAEPIAPSASTEDSVTPSVEPQASPAPNEARSTAVAPSESPPRPPDEPLSQTQTTASKRVTTEVIPTDTAENQLPTPVSTQEPDRASVQPTGTTDQNEEGANEQYEKSKDEYPVKRRRLTPPKTQIQSKERAPEPIQQRDSAAEGRIGQERESATASVDWATQIQRDDVQSAQENRDTATIGLEDRTVSTSEVTTGASDERTTTVGDRGPSTSISQTSKTTHPVRKSRQPPVQAASPPLGGTVMQTIEGPDSSAPQPKPRKVRKDKGTKRIQKSQGGHVAVSGARGDAGEGVSATISGAITRKRNSQIAGDRTSTNEGEVNSGSAQGSDIELSNSQLRKTQTSATPGTKRPAAATPGGTAGRRKRQRRKTPEENEAVEITPSITTMHDLCKDTRTGKTSEREKKLQAIDWGELSRQQANAVARVRSLGSVLSTAQAQRENAAQELEATAQTNSHHGPVLRLVNGQFRVDETSLQIDRHAAQENEAEVAEAAIEESDISRRVNTMTWLYDNKREPNERHLRVQKGDPWEAQETRLFYEGLRMFGTDFNIISHMFPGRTRKQIKNKFNREERENPELINEALGTGKVQMDLEQYGRAIGRGVDEDGFLDRGGSVVEAFVDPAKLEEELAKEGEEMLKEIEEVRKTTENERRQREAAKGYNEGGNKENVEAEKKRKKAEGKRKKKVPEILAGEEEVVESIE